MKRHLSHLAALLCLLCCFVTAQGATGQEPVLTLANGTKVQPLADVQFSPGKVLRPAVPKQAAKASRHKVAPKWGSLVEVDYNHGGSKQLTAEVTLAKTSATTLTVKNLAALGATLEGTYDSATSTISVKPGVVYSNAQMGYEVWVCKVDFVHMTYDNTSAITGTMHPDGTVTLGSWGLFIPSGTYANYSFGVYDSTQLVNYNATERDVIQGTDSVVTTRVFAEQTDAGTLSIFNFGGYGQPVDVQLQGGNIATVGVQMLYYDIKYGFYHGIDKADYSKDDGYVDGRVPGTVTSTSLKLGNWGLYIMPSMRSRASESQARAPLTKYGSTEIAFDKLQLTLPDAVDQSWTGSGSATDPYVITTSKQLHGLAVSVLQGNSYAGKTVALGADINLGDQNVFLPIGDGPATLWQGTFDGRGHTISGLETSAADETPYFGLFGLAGAQSTIKNVKLSGFNIATNSNPAGTLAGASVGTVSQITVTGADLTYVDLRQAGVVGEFAGSLIDHVSFTGAISTTGAAAGIVGLLSTKATHLSAVGTISRTSGNGNLAGLVGALAGSLNDHAILSDSYSALEIYDDAGLAEIGGLAGSANNATIERCFSTGSVSSNVTWSRLGAPAGSVGGLVGDADGLTMTDCYTTSLVSNGKESDQVGLIVGKIEMKKGVLRGAPKRAGSINDGAPCSFTRVLSLGMSDAYRPTATEAFYGTNGGSDTAFHQCYFDRQLLGNAFVGSDRGKLTSELTAGPLEGFSTDVWQFSPGSYPALRSLADVPAQTAAIAPVTLGVDEQMNLIKRDFKVSTKGGVAWKLYDAAKRTVVDSNDIMTVSDSTVTLKGVTGSGYILAIAPGNTNVRKVLKYLVLKSGAFSGGDGSEANPYLVSTPADWLELAQCVNQGIKFQNNYFRQTNDIDFATAGSGTSTTFNGVANGANTMHVFGGDFDGGNYKLQNLHIKTITVSTNGTADYTNATMETGLFGIVTIGGRVHNVVMDSTCLVEGSYLVGGIAGSVDGTVDHCANLGTVKAYWSNAGGIAGYVETTGLVSDCFNGGNVISGGAYAAGIAGDNLGRVEYCQNNGTITAAVLSTSPAAGKQSNVAGIVALNEGYVTRIIGNINLGQIVSPSKASGIVDQWTTTSGATTVATGNINLGYVVNQSSTATDVGWLSAMNTGTRQVSDNYNDAQIIRVPALHGAPAEGATNVGTRQLTATTPLQGIDTAHVSLVAGQYPAIKWAADVMPMAQAMRQMVVTLHDGEDLTSISHPAGLYKADGLVWTLKQGKDFTIDGDTLRLAATEAIVRTDTLVATKDGYSREFVIGSVAVDLEGNGSADNPYLIKTVADMHQVAHYTNDYSYGFNGKYLKLANDINFADSTYVIVGQGSNSFAGDFDGAGHQLQNVKLSSADAQAGLFGMVTATGRIHDLTLASGTIGGASNVGGLVGQLQGTIEGCTNAATVTATGSNAGGIAGKVNAGASITGCTNSGTIKAATEGTGGIVGNADAGVSITGCVNKASFTGTKSTGGIAGVLGGSADHCVNQGTIGGTSNVAGIAASATNASFAHNANLGAVSGSSYVAGIVGYTSKATAIDSCTNSGNITVSGNYAGGIAGYAKEEYSSHITACYNTGTIAGGKSVGGILGTTNTSSVGTLNGVDTAYVVDHCYNLGTVKGASQVGGLIGNNGVKVWRCYNLGAVSGSSFGVGGLVGDGSRTFKLIESFNAGDVTSTATGLSKRPFMSNVYYGNIGGLVGTGYVHATDCFNTGTVTGHKAMGGITGHGNASLTRVYNAGRIVAASDSANVGNITSSKFNGYGSKLQDIVAYDKNVNADVKTGTTDADAQALSTHALSELDLGDAWTLRAGFYPALKCFDGVAASDYATATIVPEEGETYEKMVSEFAAGMTDSVTWTYPADSIKIEDGKGGSLVAGDFVVTKHYLGFSHSYKLHYDDPSGFSGVSDVLQPAAQVLQVRYVNVAGQVARQPWQGVNLVVTTYTDGSVTSKKMLIKR